MPVMFITRFLVTLIIHNHHIIGYIAFTLTTYIHAYGLPIFDGAPQGDYTTKICDDYGKQMDIIGEFYPDLTACDTAYCVGIWGDD